MAAVLAIVLIFRNADSAAAAYGIAVTGTMLTTSLLTYVVLRHERKWSAWRSAAILTPFIAVETVFLVANLTKIMQGGAVPLMITGLMALMMFVWVRGSRALRLYCRRDSVELESLIKPPTAEEPEARSGMTVFLTGNPGCLPKPMLRYMEQEQCSRSCIVCIVIEHVPFVPAEEKFVVQAIGPRITNVIIHLGYMEDPDLPRLLNQAPLHLEEEFVRYILLRRECTAPLRTELKNWQIPLFKMLKKAAAHAEDFYRLPRERTVRIEAS